MQTENILVRSALVVWSGIIISSIIIGTFYYETQSHLNRDSLSVTGSTKVSVTSDQAKLVIAITRNVPVSALASGNTAIAKDFGLLSKLLSSKTIEQKDITVGPVFMDQSYDQNQGTEIRYNLHQTATIQSDDITKVTELSKAIPELVSQGAIVAIQSLEYYYSKLPELRVTLLAEAVKDAEVRAKSIAQSTGREVGEIRSASSGVVQVMQANSVDIADYGMYDTTSIEKDIMVTVKASFGLK